MATKCRNLHDHSYQAISNSLKNDGFICNGLFLSDLLSNDIQATHCWCRNMVLHIAMADLQRDENNQKQVFCTAMLSTPNGCSDHIDTVCLHWLH